MIREIKFENFRNLSGRSYKLNHGLNVIVGKNSSGKTNFLDGLKLAFYTLTGDYFSVSLGDFTNSDDSNNIQIEIVLEKDAIPSLISLDSKNQEVCGFRIIVKKSQSGKYIKQLKLLNGNSIDIEIVREDSKLPKIQSIPLQRIEDIFTPGLTFGITQFIESEEKYKDIMKDSKQDIKKQIKKKEDEFKKLCNKFNQSLCIELSDPKISNERLFVVDGEKEHNIRIGSGYKSIANIFINAINEDYNILFIDEIENHLHPSLIRNLIRELRKIKNILLITTTHSPVVINEMFLDELIHISGIGLSCINDDEEGTIKKKLNQFLHPGRNELILADNVILVEGYTEEMLIRYYLNKRNENWTVINVAGVMFEPYILLSLLLNKKLVVISDNDNTLKEDRTKSDRFLKLQKICTESNITLLEMNNTLETDLYNGNFLDDRFNDLLMSHSKFSEVKIAKPKTKTMIAERMIELEIDLSEWHIIKGIRNEFQNN